MKTPLHFHRFDIRPLLADGIMPLPEIESRLAALTANEGLVVQAPFLPSPLIEVLQRDGWKARVERGNGAEWLVYVTAAH